MSSFSIFSFFAVVRSGSCLGPVPATGRASYARFAGSAPVNPPEVNRKGGAVSWKTTPNPHDAFYLTCGGMKLMREQQRATEWALTTELDDSLPSTW